MHKKITLSTVALAVALLFHACGIIGILLSPYKDWFIRNTPLNILLMSVLLVLTHPSKNKNFFIFFIAAYIIGFAAEVAGVHTALLFGEYSYSKILGVQLFNVPLIIGFNWFMIIYCTGTITQVYEDYMLKKMREQGIEMKQQLKFLSFIVDGALLILLFDWVMEPAAVKLGYWQWKENTIPLYNYVCWIVISALLFALFKKLNIARQNTFAVHLFIIQFLFFWILRTFL
jgi:putative membrane protein